MNGIKAIERLALAQLTVAVEAEDKVRARILARALEVDEVALLVRDVKAACERLEGNELTGRGGSVNIYDTAKVAIAIVHELARTATRLNVLVDQIVPAKEGGS